MDFRFSIFNLEQVTDAMQSYLALARIDFRM